MSKPVLASLARSATAAAAATARTTNLPSRHALRVATFAAGGANGATLKVAQRGGDGDESATKRLAALTLASAALGLACGASALERDDVEAQCERAQTLLRAPKDTRGHYALFNELGRGGFSIVRLALDMDTDQLLAAKIFDPKYCSTQDIRDEIDTLRHLGKHPNIVSLHDVLYLKDETIMFMDLVQGGELFDYIVDMGSISEKDASRMLRDACRALEYMHSLGICHRDLKPENLLLTTRSPEADIKVADFGMSRRQRKGEKVLETQPNGTIAYWSPEIIKRQPQDFGVDMWAFGVLAYITLTGVHPFDPKGDQSDAEIVRAIAKGEYDVKNPWYRDLSNEAKDFVAKLLQSDPSKRLTAKDALAHTWLKGKMVSTEPLAVGHTERLLAFQRLQHLRANILAVIMGVQHSKLAQAATADRTQSEDDSSHVPARTTTVNMDMFKDTFALFDKDESGGIDRDELEAAMCALGQRLSRSELDAIMQQADSDGDGKISFLEFASMMNQRLFRQGELTEADLKSAFDIYDTNHDGFISSSELAYMLHLLGKHTFTDEDVASIIDVADTNHDGQIDYAEFCQLMRHVGAKRDAGSGSP